MAGQGFERRDLIRMLAMASLASTFPGFQRWVFACPHEGLPSTPPAQRTEPFRPQFFTADEFQLVDQLAELIIPTDDTPGAHDAGVAEFIDFMVANGADLTRSKEGNIDHRFRSGLKWMNTRAQSLWGRSFLKGTPEQQTQLLESLAYKKHFRSGEEEGQKFFQLMRDYTAKGYYTSRIGLEALGYPGLQTVWAEMPGCPHKDDPEHLHLPPPVV